VQINGKFVCVVDLCKSSIGDSQKIFSLLQECDNPKLERLKGKDLCDFKSALAVKDKPVVNFIL
jgi:hypothetical protein